MVLCGVNADQCLGQRSLTSIFLLDPVTFLSGALHSANTQTSTHMITNIVAILTVPSNVLFFFSFMLCFVSIVAKPPHF